MLINWTALAVKIIHIYDKLKYRLRNRLSLCYSAGLLPVKMMQIYDFILKSELISSK